MLRILPHRTADAEPGRADCHHRAIAALRPAPRTHDRAVTTLDGLGRPNWPAIHALVATSLSRSTPVSMPSPLSIQTRSSVARLPVALSAYGQPPRPPALASNV